MLCGAGFDLALKHARVSERTLQLWIQRFNEQGIDGITYRPRPGRPRSMTASEVASGILPVIDDPGQAGETHWTATKLCGWLREQRALDISYRTLLRYLHEHDYARRIPRRFPLPADPGQWKKQREEFVPQLLGLLQDPRMDVFFGDEAGFEGDPRPRLRWVKRGSCPTTGYYGGHVRANAVGAICPGTGQLVSLVVPYCNREVFQLFLDTMAQEVPPSRGRKLWLVLDNASWHKAKSLNWHHINPLYLPPYSPDFNPIERLWQHIKSNYLAGFITGDHQELDDKLCESIRQVMVAPDTLQSVCRVSLK